MQQTYIAIAIGALASVVVLMILMRKMRPRGRLSFLAGLSFTLVIAGIVFGENRWLGYVLLSLGVLLAVVDAVKKMRK